MYTRFFGFHEKPFQLVPNPAYLYLSRSHEEALAHLAYAVDHGDGFVAVTGEVGTGKTTLCRAFLENLEAGIIAAYIFNPKLNAVQLLQSINAEFGLPSKSTQIKDLIDTLNAFLMAQKKARRRVVIVIDEAQNLNRDVLEQLRLISNLETTQSKLVQIILVGQPELDTLLQTGELRQLSQRINLRAQIRPLGGQEIPAYIQHRLEVASGGDPLARFQPTALRAITRVTGGTPRLINIICDRSLLAAYGHNQFIITGAMVRDAIRELIQQGYHGFTKPRPAGVSVAVAGLILLGLFWIGMEPGQRLISHWRQQKNLNGVATGKAAPPPPGTDLAAAPVPPTNKLPRESNPPNPSPVSINPQKTSEPSQAPTGSPPPKASAPASTVPVEAKQPALPHLDLNAYLARTETLPSRKTALELVISRWREIPRHTADLNSVPSSYAYFRVAGHQNGLKVTRLQIPGDLLATLNLPSILPIKKNPDGIPGYLVLAALDNGQPLLSDGPHLIPTTWKELSPYWRGTVYIPWENYLGYGDVISEEAAPESILNLKMHLREIGLSTINLDPVYDQHTRAQVADLQAAHGLPVDGIVGPMTKMVLYNLGKKWPTPRLSDRPYAEETP